MRYQFHLFLSYILFVTVFVTVAWKVQHKNKKLLSSLRDFEMEDSYLSVSIENLYSIIKILTEINPPRSYAHPESLDRIASFISKKFIGYGYRPLEQPFAFKGQTYQNIIASIGPDNAPRIVIGAHYDVCGEQPGADDNASGVAGLLELARLLATGGNPLQCRIDLAAYTLEEPPASFTQFMGSYVHALSLKMSGTLVKG